MTYRLIEVIKSNGSNWKIQKRLVHRIKVFTRYDWVDMEFEFNKHKIIEFNNYDECLDKFNELISKKHYPKYNIIKECSDDQDD